MRFRLPRLASLAVPLENEAQRLNYINITIEGCLAVAAIQAVANFAIIYAMELGATNSQVGLMVSLPFLANALVILAGARFVARQTSILRSTCFVSAMHRVFVLCMLPAPWLPAHIRVWWVIVTYSLATAAAALTSTWWMAMMSDVFPHRNRGAVFGTRALFTGSAGVAATLVTGQALDIMPFPLNFTVMFTLAAATGFVAVHFLTQTRLPASAQRAPAADIGMTSSAAADLRIAEPDAPFTPRWRDIMRGDAGRAFAWLAVPVFLFNIGFHLAAPVMNIYFVEHLHLSKGRIGLLTSVFLICQVLSSRFWGRLGDKAGNHVVACASMTILAVQAAVYCLAPSMTWLIVMQGLGGVAFGGYAMSTFNGIIVIGSARERPVLISLFNVVAGLGGFVSPTFGAALLDKHGLLAAFLIAALLRAAGAVAIAAPARVEWRKGGLSRLLYLRHFRWVPRLRRTARVRAR